jgi:tetratricopeptide (TPR) repeat protein
MAAEIDVYALCPCGSGKKLKFCCLEVAPEMQKVFRLEDDGQVGPALQLLEVLEKKTRLTPWSRAWVLSTRASLLFGENRAEEAEPFLEQALQAVPNHGASLIFSALLNLQKNGRAKSWELINRACEQASAQGAYGSLAPLLMQVGQAFLEERQYLAARHFFQQGNFASGNHQATSEVFAELCGSVAIPYPFRSIYVFRKTKLSETEQTKVAEAEGLSQRGCLIKAIPMLQRLAMAHPEDSDVWHNLALCHAWSGETIPAIEAFRKAATFGKDFDTVVDDEVLLQLLTEHLVEPQLETWGADLAIAATSKLLTLFDQQPKFIRQPPPQASPEQQEAQPVAQYAILDRPPQTTLPATPAEATRLVGNLLVYDADPSTNHPAQALLTVAGAEQFQATLKELRELAGSEITGEPRTQAVGQRPALFAPFYEEFFLPAKTTLRDQLAFASSVWQRLVTEVWPATPQKVLGGKTPQQAASNPDLKRSLAAAVIVLEAVCESRGYVPETDLIRSRLGLPATGTLEITEETQLNSLSLLELRRVPVMQLTDGQLLSLIRLLSVWRINGLMHQVLVERLARPGMQQELPKDKACLFLAKIARSRMVPAESLTWLARARQEALARQAQLHDQFAIDLQELAERGDADRKDPELAALANRIWSQYATKVAELRPMLTQLLTELELPGPWQAGSPDGGSFAAATKGSGLWTPESAAPAGGSAGGGGKLWIPGQQ